jgi:transposase
VTHAAERLGISHRALYRWLRRYREMSTTRSLLNKSPGPAARWWAAFGR